MRKIRSIFAVIGVGLLLVGGYTLPTIVTTIEDKHLQSDKKRFEIEAIELQTSQIDFFQELYRFSALMAEDAYIQNKQEEPQNGRIYQQVQKTIMDFLELLGTDVFYKLEEMRVYSFVLADFETEQLYPIWFCNAVNENGEVYSFWIDEITGKILSFQLPENSMKATKDDFEEILGTIVNYYEFEEYGFEGIYEKAKLWSGTLVVVHNKNKEHMYFPFYKNEKGISFNLYNEKIKMSKSISSYDAK